MPNFPQNPYVGQIVTWQGSEYKWNGSQWINLTVPEPFAVPVFISVSAPQPPITEGTFWFNTVASILNIWVIAPGGSSWVPVTDSLPANTGVVVSISPPEDPVSGTLWYNPHSHLFQVWVVTGLSSQWVVLSDCEPDVDNPPVVVSISPPLNPPQGTLWYLPTNSTLSLWVNTPQGGSWVVLTSNNPQRKPTVFVSSSPPTNPAQGDLWFNPSRPVLKVWNIFLNTGQWLDTVPCGLFEAAAAAEESAQQASAAAELAQYWAEQAQLPLGETLIDSSQSGIIYVGKAPAGALENDPVWTIRKSTFSPAGVLLSEETFENVSWTDRYLLPI